MSTVATYDYTNENGNPLYRVVRRQGKKFHQERFDAATGQYIGGPGAMNGVQRVLYHLKEIVMSSDRTPIFIVEGEKDVDNLTALGLTATTSPGGAGKWGMVDSEPLRDRPAIVCPDNDERGRAHARDVCRDLHDKALEVRVLMLQDLPPKGDVSDYIQSRRGAGWGNDAIRDELLGMATDAQTCPPAEPDEQGTGDDVTTPIDAANELTELGFSKSLIDQHGHELRYVNGWGWMHWTETHWKQDDHGAPMRLAKAVIRKAFQRAAKIEDADKRDAILRPIRKLGRYSAIKGIVLLAESDPRIRRGVADFDKDPWVLNVKNGTIDLRTMRLRPHDPNDHITKLADVDYDPGAKCPRFERFLGEILDGNVELVGFVSRALGYTLTGDTREQVLFLFHGRGANGKSVLLQVIQKVLGDYAVQANTGTFMARCKEGVRNDIARLCGARMVAAVETNEGAPLDESLIKTLTGCDTVTARYMYKEHFEFHPEFKLYLAANHKPRVQGQDRAIWRRVMVIPFNVAFEGDKADKTLLEKLLAELPGILNLMLRGLAEWRAGGLRPPAAVMMATADYKVESDVLAEWLEAHCVLGSRHEIESNRLYADYKAWTAGNGEKPLSKPTFTARLNDKGVGHRRTRKARWTTGIGLLADLNDAGDAVAPDSDNFLYPHAREDLSETAIGASPASPSMSPNGLNGVKNADRCPTSINDPLNDTLDIAPESAELEPSLHPNVTAMDGVWR